MGVLLQGGVLALASLPSPISPAGLMFAHAIPYHLLIQQWNKITQLSRQAWNKLQWHCWVGKCCDNGHSSYDQKFIEWINWGITREHLPCVSRPLELKVMSGYQVSPFLYVNQKFSCGWKMFLQPSFVISAHLNVQFYRKRSNRSVVAMKNS